MEQEKQNGTIPQIAFKKAKQLESQIRKVVIGQDRVVREVIVSVLAGGHVLVEGVPGLGKTLLVQATAAAVSGRFSRIQFTPDLMPADISGHAMYDMKSNSFRVRKGPVFCNLLLADEINRAPAKTQSALLEVMQEHQVSIEGKSYPLESPFFVLATQNPIEQEGTYPLPQAQLDRFLLKVHMEYPKTEDEKNITRQVTTGAVGDRLDVSAVQRVLGKADLVNLQKAAAALITDDRIIEYAVDIVRATRESSGIEIGAGPRGSIALLRTARAGALMEGRSFVTPDDVKAIAPAVLRHRVRLTPDLEIDGYRVDEVLDDILSSVKAPRQ
ncbi:MAG: AAA family ATPase [Thermodesulfobacteriota bacterium]